MGSSMCVMGGRTTLLCTELFFVLYVVSKINITFTDMAKYVAVLSLRHDAFESLKSLW